MLIIHPKQIGSPPRMRGKLGKRIGNAGITPAGAGKTCYSSSNPRYRDESPPQVRGKRAAEFRHGGKAGITPAGAGKTHSTFTDLLQKRDHPRRCGENRAFAKLITNIRGSPPQVRGKPTCARGGLDRVRITPADAGKTSSMSLTSTPAEDHPRGCGENTSCPCMGTSTLGSPPRMRGKQQGIKSPPEHCRITPADAGKTPLRVRAKW